MKAIMHLTLVENSVENENLIKSNQILPNTQDKSRVNITVLEGLFLRSYVHDFSFKQIAYFLEIDQQKLLKLIEVLKKKFQVETESALIMKAFDKEILKKSDMLCRVVKKQALEESFIFVSELFPTQDFLLGRIQQRVKRFYKSCESTLFDKYQSRKPEDLLTLVELDYINLKYLGESDKYIQNKLQTEMGLDDIERRICKKLNTNHCFNVFMACFQRGLIDKPADFSSVLNTEAFLFSKKVLYMKDTLVNVPFKEKQLHVYMELVKFYNAILFTNFYTKK